MPRNGIDVHRNPRKPPAPLPDKCTGHQKRTGLPCKNKPCEGRTTCRMHGGTSKVGVESHRFKTGRYSKYLPKKLKETYETALTDPELLAMRDDIALMDSRLADLFGKLANNETPMLWAQLRQALKDFIVAKNDVSPSREQTAIHRLTDLIENGGKEVELWQGIHDTVEQRRKLAESERKRLIDLKQMIPAERAAILLGAVRETVRLAVLQGCSDQREAQAILERISFDITALSNLPENFGPRLAMKELAGGKG